jgi:lipopolysaccharide export LptBFGC system permease protein LptF
VNLRHGVTARHIATVGLVALVVAVLVWGIGRRSGTVVPSPSWVAIALLAVMGGLVLTAAWPVRKHLSQKATRVLDPLRAARAAVLAQAAALTGAGAVGWYLGSLLVSIRDLGLAIGRAALPWLVAAILASALLVACGLVAQAWCRIDEDDQDRPPPGAAPSAS